MTVVFFVLLGSQKIMKVILIVDLSSSFFISLIKSKYILSNIQPLYYMENCPYVMKFIKFSITIDLNFAEDAI